MSQTIKHCRSCGSDSLQRFLDLGRQPLANSLHGEKDIAPKAHELSLCQCTECGLVQLTIDVTAGDMFSDYLWVTGTSQTARSYAKEICNEILFYAKANPIGDKVFEVASNDGTFLQPFKDKGFKVIGVDPARNLAELANKKGIPTISRFFSSQVAKEIVKEFGKSKVVICRNVLAHIPDISDFLKGLEEVLTPDGVLLIEVHYAGSILEGLQYDSIYHEHASYISLSSIWPRLRELGLEVFHTTLGPISGGSLTLYIKKNNNKEIAIKPSVKQFQQKEIATGISSLDTWTDFSTNVKNHSKEFVDILRDRKSRGKKICGFGASARSSTLLNYAKIDRSIIKMIADSNPNKHGRVTAGSQIPVVPPMEMFDTKPDVIVILAWNFQKELVSIIRKSGFEGELLVPLPGKPKFITKK